MKKSNEFIKNQYFSVALGYNSVFFSISVIKQLLVSSRRGGGGVVEGIQLLVAINYATMHFRLEQKVILLKLSTDDCKIIYHSAKNLDTQI